MNFELIALVALSVVILMTAACAGTVNMMRLLMHCRLRLIWAVPWKSSPHSRTYSNGGIWNDLLR